MHMKKTIQEYWNWCSATYHDEYIDSADKERLMWKKILNTSFPQDHTMNILDIGTGPGLMALAFAEMGHNVTAIDISDKMLKEARKNAENLNLAIDFYQGDAEALPFKEGQFDAVISKYLLWTLPSPEKFLNECSRLLTEDGTFLAIDGMWFKPSISKSIRCSIAGIMGNLSGKNVDNIFSRHYGGIKNELPLYYKNSPENISYLLINNGYSGVSYRHLPEIPKFHRQHTALQCKIRGINTPFIITGIKTE